MNEANLDNALVDQKNTLLRRIATAGDVDGLLDAIGLLDFAAPVWEACTYGYKVRELQQVVRETAAAMLAGEQGELPHYRRNSSLHNRTLLNISRLEGILP
jgi:hypothetical protein